MASKKFHKKTTGLLVIYIVGVVLFCTGFGSPNWVEAEYSYSGLWKHCSRDPYTDKWTCGRFGITHHEPWMASVCGLLIVALSFASFAGCVYVFLPVSAAFHIFAALFTFLGVATYAMFLTADNRITLSDLGWAFWITCAGGFVLLVNGITLAAMACTHECKMYRMLPPADEEEY